MTWRAKKLSLCGAAVPLKAGGENESVPTDSLIKMLDFTATKGTFKALSPWSQQLFGE